VLGAPELKDSSSQEELIVISYRLHSLYIAFENIFRNIATAFENQISQESWHREVLQRMRLNLDSLRLQVVLRRTLELKGLYRGQVERFLDFLRGIDPVAP
jgi:hypothetical protein